MFGLLPSHTMRPVSSWLNPSRMNARRNVPDCELPSEIAQRTTPATGFGVPAVVRSLVAEERIDIARGREPDAEHERILRRVLQLVQQRGIEAVLQADVRRIRRAGKRRVLARRERPVGARNSSPRRLLTPSALSDTADTSVAFVVSSVAGGYGDGVPRGMISAGGGAALFEDAE